MDKEDAKLSILEPMHMHAFSITLVPLGIATTYVHLELLVLLHTGSYTAPVASVMLPLLLLILLLDFAAVSC